MMFYLVDSIVSCVFIAWIIYNKIGGGYGAGGDGRGRGYGAGELGTGSYCRCKLHKGRDKKCYVYGDGM